MKNELVTTAYLIYKIEEGMEILEFQKLVLIYNKKYGYRFIKEVGYC